MTGKRIAVLAAALAGLVLAGCGGGEALRSQEDGDADEENGGGDGAPAPVKIGLLVPTSGVYTSLGEDMRRGFDLYLDQNGGQLGGRDVELVTADEGAGPDTGVPAARRLVTRDRVAVVTGIVNSAVALGVRDFFTEAKVPLLISNAGADDLTGEAGSPFLWRTSFANSDPNLALGGWLAATPEAEGGVFMLGADYAAGKEQLGGFRKAFEEGGGKVLGEVYTPFGTTQDFQPFLTQARQSGAKAVFAFYAGAEAVTFVRQYAEFGLAETTPLYGPGFLTEGSVLDAQGPASIGIKTSLHYASELDTPLNTKFVTAYQEVYGDTPTTYSVQSYDAALVLDEAIGRLDGEITGRRLVDAFGRIGDIDSPRGEWRFGEDQNPDQSFYLREVRTEGEGLVNAVLEDLGPLDVSASS
ncbi:MAG: ABC transporter substrate-binding protein [Acidimicrobiia bacterium]